MIEWKTREISIEPLILTAADVPASCVINAKNKIY